MTAASMPYRPRERFAPVDARQVTDATPEGYWPKAWIATVVVLTLMMLRLGEQLGPLRVAKPVFSAAIVLVGCHLMFSGARAWGAAWRSRQLHLMVVYAACIGASVPYSQWPGLSFGILKILPWGCAMVLLVSLTPPLLSTSDRVLRWTSWMTAVTCIFVLVSGRVVEGSRITTGGSYDPNDLGALLAMILPFAIGAALRERGVRRAVSVIAGMIIIGTLLATGSRGALLALVAMVAAFVLSYPPRRSALALVAVVLMAPVAWQFAPPVMRERAATLFSLEEDYNTNSSSGRVYLWKRGLQFVAQSPLVGVGAGTFDLKIGRDFKELGTRGAWHTAHNTYVQSLAELGIPGGLVLLLMLARAVRNAWPFWRWRARVHRPELLASLVAYLVAILFLSHAYSYLFFGVIAMSALTEQLRSRLQRSPATPAPRSMRAPRRSHRVSSPAWRPVPTSPVATSLADN